MPLLQPSELTIQKSNTKRAFGFFLYRLNLTGREEQTIPTALIQKNKKTFGGYLSLWSEVVKSNDIHVRLNGLMNLRL